MKYVIEDGGLYDPAVRESVSGLAENGDTSRFEAAAAVRVAAHAVERMRSAGAGSRALSSGAIDVLVRLTMTDLLTVGELATAAGVSSRNATGLVDTLERAELVQRETDPADRRSVRVRLTATGRKWVEDFRRPATMAMDAMFHGFSSTEVAALRDLCLRLVVNQEAIARRMGASSTAD